MARPEAAGRLQRADQDRDGGTQPRRAARGLGQPMPSQQVSPTSSYMNSESLESTVRLEANELQRHWDESQNLGPWHLSLRIGDGSAGLIRAERKSATELKVVLDQKAEHIQYIQVRRLADDAGHLIIECPACCRWRGRCICPRPDLVPTLKVSGLSARTVRFRDQVSREDQTNQNLVVAPRDRGSA